MVTLTFPDIGIKSVAWRLESRTQTFTSPLSGTTQTLELPGAKWAADIEMTPMTEIDKRGFSSFLVQLRGKSGRFYLQDPSNTGTLGIATGTPLVNTAISNTAVAIGSSGWTPSTTGILKAGDMIGFSNDEMKMVIADVDSDVSGDATILVEPPFRNQPGDTSAIEVSQPVCIMHLKDDDQAQWQATTDKIYYFRFSCEEALV